MNTISGERAERQGCEDVRGAVGNSDDPVDGGPSPDNFQEKKP